MPRTHESACSNHATLTNSKNRASTGVRLGLISPERQITVDGAGSIPRARTKMRSLGSLDRASASEAEGTEFESPREPHLRSGAVADGSAAGFENQRHGNVRGSTPHRSAIFFGRLTDPGGRHRLECEWYALCAYEHRALSLPPNYGSVTGQESGARSKRDGWPCHWGSGPHVSASYDTQTKFCRPDGPAVCDGDESRKRILCREVRDPGSLISCSRSVRLRSLQPTKRSGSADKDRLLPSPRCKRGPFGQAVQFRPLPTKRQHAGVA